MTPVIYTGPPDPEHGGNLPQIRYGVQHILYATRERPDGAFVHGAAVILSNERYHYSIVHSSDDLGDWLRRGWTITSY